jgi:hypothetical protein
VLTPLFFIAVGTTSSGIGVYLTAAFLLTQFLKTVFLSAAILVSADLSTANSSIAVLEKIILVLHVHSKNLAGSEAERAEQ